MKFSYSANILLIFLLIGCKNAKDKSGDFNSADYKENRIDFIHGTLLLPKDYQELAKDDYQFYVEKTVASTFVFSNLIDLAKANKKEWMVFSNSGNKNDFIFIVEGEYVNFSKQNANQYLGLLSSELRDSWGGLGVEYERLEEKMTQTERSKYIKIKYKLKHKASFLYFTQYIITSKYTTFGVNVFNSHGADFEALVKRVLFKL